MKKILCVVAMLAAASMSYGQNRDIRQINNTLTRHESQLNANATAIANNTADIVANATTAASSGTTLQKGNGSGGFSASSISETNQVIVLGTNGTAAVGYNLKFGAGAAPTISSATSIAPTNGIVFISGTATITNITAPIGIATKGGTIIAIPTGAFILSATGSNIKLQATGTVSRAMSLSYDPTTAFWYPSYQ